MRRLVTTNSKHRPAGIRVNSKSEHLAKTHETFVEAMCISPTEVSNHQTVSAVSRGVSDQTFTTCLQAKAPRFTIEGGLSASQTEGESSDAGSVAAGKAVKSPSVCSVATARPVLKPNSNAEVCPIETAGVRVAISEHLPNLPVVAVRRVFSRLKSRVQQHDVAGSLAPLTLNASGVGAVNCEVVTSVSIGSSLMQKSVSRHSSLERGDLCLVGFCRTAV